MKVKQLSVFVENQPGRLAAAASLKKAKVKVLTSEEVSSLSEVAVWRPGRSAGGAER
jgi:hypothetical protein